MGTVGKTSREGASLSLKNDKGNSIFLLCLKSALIVEVTFMLITGMLIEGTDYYGGPFQVGTRGISGGFFGGFPSTFEFLPFIINLLITAIIFLPITKLGGNRTTIAATTGAVVFLVGSKLINLQLSFLPQPWWNSYPFLWITTMAFASLSAILWQVFKIAIRHQ